MWAWKTGKADIEVERALVYFRFAEELGFTPEAVDRMDKDLVSAFMVFMDERKKSQEAAENIRRLRAKRKR